MNEELKKRRITGGGGLDNGNNPRIVVIFGIVILAALLTATFIFRSGGRGPVSRDAEEEEEMVSSDSTYETTIEARRATAESLAEENAAVIKALLPYFRNSKDEFDEDGTTWYIPKSAPESVAANTCYFYFGKKANGYDFTLFRLRAFYYGNDWIFFDTVAFSVDGEAFEVSAAGYSDQEVAGNGKVCEWADIPVIGDKGTELLAALEKAKKVRVRLKGKYSKTYDISESQLADMKRSVALFKAMSGGVLSGDVGFGFY